MVSFGFTSSYTPSKSKPMLPSRASIREENFPPVRKSFSAFGVCHSSEALFHLVMCSGSDQSFHTFSTGALMVVSTVMVVFAVVSILYRMKFERWMNNFGKGKDRNFC